MKMFYKAWMGVFTAVGLRSSRDGVFANETVGTMVLQESPTVMNGEAAPSLDVGSGRKPAPQEGSSMIEAVGKIIDDSQKDDTPRNPKKRMWEEGMEAKKQEQMVKDEL